MMELLVTTGAIVITTNKPTPSFFTGQMSFLSPNQQCQSTEGKCLGFNGERKSKGNQLTQVHLGKWPLNQVYFVCDN